MIGIGSKDEQINLSRSLYALKEQRLILFETLHGITRFTLFYY